MRLRASMRREAMPRWGLIAALAILLVHATGAGAAPVPGLRAAQPYAAPDWMSAETAAALDLGFDVLVPPYVPEPFSGQPALTADQDSYSLYWMIVGEKPTFLLIAGEVGGEIPDYSKYDRNNQLVQNATVAGYPAYHDLTPIYDLVYWKVGEVVYSVESRNLTSDDSLELANVLVPLSTGEPAGEGENEEAPQEEAPGPETDPVLDLPTEVGSGQYIQIGVWGVEGATLSADGGRFPETGMAEYPGAGGFAVEWQAPHVSEDSSVLFVVADGETGEWLTWGNLRVVARPDEAPPEEPIFEAQAARLAVECPDSVTSGETAEIVLTGSGYAIVDATAGSFPDGWPNNQFEPAGDAGRTFVGTLPAEGRITLHWVAPEVRDVDTVFFFATTELGETTGECAVEVAPRSATEEEGSSGEPAVGESQSDEHQAEGAGARAETTAPAPTATGEALPRDGSIKNEVFAFPTAAPGPDDGDQALSPSPAATVRGTSTPRPTATIAPTTSESGMVASIVGPEGGTLQSPRGAVLVVPQGALAEPATVSILPVANNALPASDGVDLIPDTGFDVTIAGPDGRAVEQLGAPADLRITVGDAVEQPGIKIYRVDGAGLVAQTNTRIEGEDLVISVDRFSRFVAGVPSGEQAANGRSLLPFALAASVVVIALVAMVVLGGMIRPRRQRVVVTRRPPRSGSRYR